ncbi:DUF6415 family natural product biosynthesis protein [Streptomyces sp. NPDC048566]|uniref:DUF6415 family natural product biosynthesis protein n=1 Tax=Streptomyces sp. NPDC048566 TaxID=3365569 RepID=UPI00372116E4
MRTTARDVLAVSAPPDPAWLDNSLSLLRGHIDLMIPEIQALADEMPEEDIPRYCALACLGEARRKATIEARPEISSQLAHARRLARVLNALCDHHEGLGGK